MPKVTSYTIAKKLEVVDWHKKNGLNVSATSRQFGIDRKRIREWMTKVFELLQQNYGKNKLKRRLNGGRKPLSEELDDDLYEVFEVEREKAHTVSNKFLAKEAKKIAARLGLKEFKASDHFINNWKRRFHVSLRKGTNECQKLPEDYAEAESAFRSSIRDCRVRGDLTKYNIGNMDQTMVRFDQPATRTNHIMGEHHVRIGNTGCTKRGFTVALCGRATGHKMPAFIVFKEPSGKIPARVKKTLKIPENVKVSASPSGWMTSDIMLEWISRGRNGDDVCLLLVLDQAGIHKMAEMKSALVEVETDVNVPGGCATSGSLPGISLLKTLSGKNGQISIDVKNAPMQVIQGNHHDKMYS